MGQPDTSVAASPTLADLPILLVEDDHGDAVLVEACLSEVGGGDDRLTWVRSLGEATEAVQAPGPRPGCILLDLGLPDTIGYSGVDGIVAAAPDIPVIVLTGRQERDGVAALAAGAQDYLAKDTLTPERLERSIRYAVERTRAQATQQQLREVRISAAEQARLERGLLPTPVLHSRSITCATYYQPGRDDAVLGGDFYDIVETPDGRVRAVIGDVMGHGPDEAAVGVHLRVAWRTLVLAGTPDDQVLPAMALLLAAETDEISRYVTVCDVTIDAGVMTLRVAGHPAPIVHAGGTTRYCEVAVGLPVGVRLGGRLDSGWPETKVSLEPASSVLFYTDGLLDAFSDPATSGIGITELVDAVQHTVGIGDPADGWIPALLARAARRPLDDTAVVVLTASGDT